jgi:hypothetical protein
MIRFNPNNKKTIQALMLLNKENIKLATVALFFSDIHHLNLYGRPISGQNYIKKDGKFQTLGFFQYQEESVDLDVLSQSDIEVLSLYKNKDIKDFIKEGIIDFEKFIYNKEVLSFLKTIDSLTIVI